MGLGMTPSLPPSGRGRERGGGSIMNFFQRGGGYFVATLSWGLFVRVVAVCRSLLVAAARAFLEERHLGPGASSGAGRRQRGKARLVRPFPI